MYIEGTETVGENANCHGRQQDGAGPMAPGRWRASDSNGARDWILLLHIVYHAVPLVLLIEVGERTIVYTLKSRSCFQTCENRRRMKV